VFTNLLRNYYFLSVSARVTELFKKDARTKSWKINNSSPCLHCWLTEKFIEVVCQYAMVRVLTFWR